MECFIGPIKKDEFIGDGCDDADPVPINAVTNMTIPVTHMGVIVTHGGA